MFDLFYSEMLKLKRSLFLWMIPLSVITIALLQYGSLVYQHNQHPGTVFQWNWLVFTNFRYVTTFIGPEIAFCMGYLIAQEFHERTINQLFTYSIGRLPFLFTKYAVMALMVVTILVLELACTIGAGLMFEHKPLSSDLLLHYVHGFGWLTLMSLAYLPLAATLAMIWKSYLPNAVFGLITLVSGIIVANSDYALYYPWSTPITLLDEWMKKGSFAASSLNVAGGVITLLLTFLIPFLFNLYYYKKMDVDNA